MNGDFDLNNNFGNLVNLSICSTISSVSGLGIKVSLVTKNLHGFSDKEIKGHVDKILDFAGLKRFADTKLKNCW